MMRGSSLNSFAKLMTILMVTLTIAGCGRLPIISSFNNDSRSATEQRASRANAGREAYQVTVRRNDTLSEIALRNGVPTRTLANANGIRAPFTIYAGQELTVPARPQHTVRRGESLSVIAERYDMTTRDLARDNRIRRADRIYAGQVLILPWSADAPAAARGNSSRARSEMARSGRTTERATPNRRAQRAAPSPRRVSPAPVTNTGARDLTPPSRSGDGFMWPVDGNVIGEFGSSGGGRRNDGINIAAREGMPIRAADNGVVIYAGNEVPGFGNLVLIRHDGGYVTAYAHQSRINVRQGHEVERGEIIGLVGRTGRVSEPQLHFEVRRNSRAVNPAQFLAGA